MEFEINKELVVSVVHITPNAGEWLEENKVHFSYSSDMLNWRLHVDNLIEAIEGINEDTIARVDGYEYPELLKALKLAKSHKCKWLVIDQDGPYVEQLVDYSNQWE